MEVSADPALTILAYAAEPGSRDEHALKLLGWNRCPACSRVLESGGDYGPAA